MEGQKQEEEGEDHGLTLCKLTLSHGGASWAAESEKGERVLLEKLEVPR